MTRLEDNLAGTAAMRLMVLEGISLKVRDAQFLVGQEDLGWGRKLPRNQNSGLIWSQVVPVLVSRSAGLRGPGHQNQ